MTFDRRDLHPGAAASLAKLGMDETQLAKAMAAGELASPQRFANSWYFALRITGTEAAYRKKLDEIAWRDPKIYLTQEFLDRCSGLPVIVDHPPGNMLDTKEFSDRVVGMVVLPYIGGSGGEDLTSKEVWGIARIVDQGAAQHMREHKLSTSPAVVFLDPTVNTTVPLKGGRQLLIEGKPALLDHLAICEAGVWDKQGPPSGVATTPGTEAGDAGVHRGDSEMTEEERKAEEERERADAARRDAEAGEKLDKILEGITSVQDRQDRLERRMDAYDSRRDADEEKAAEEAKQAAELEKLAAEEAKEAEEAEEDSRDDSRHRDDAHPHHLMRREDESCDEHSERVDALPRVKALKRRDDEKCDDHSARVDAAALKHLKRDDRHRDDGDLHILHKDDDSEEMEEVPVEELERKDRERDDAYSRRIHDVAKKHDAKSFMRKDRERADSHAARLDAMVRARRARRDADARIAAAEEEAKLAKADAADAKRVALALQRKVEDRTSEEDAALADAQARADDAYSALGERAPRPLMGETLAGYRLRSLRGLQSHSPTWKDEDLSVLAKHAATAFSNAEATIYADAVAAANSPALVPEGQLREIIKIDRATGRRMTEFAGRPLAWMRQFMPPPRRMIGIRQPPR